MPKQYLHGLYYQVSWLGPQNKDDTFWRTNAWLDRWRTPSKSPTTSLTNAWSCPSLRRIFFRIIIRSQETTIAKLPASSSQPSQILSIATSVDQKRSSKQDLSHYKWSQDSWSNLESSEVKQNWIDCTRWEWRYHGWYKCTWLFHPQQQVLVK